MPTLHTGQIPHDEWREAARVRKSRRSFDGEPIADETLDELDDFLGKLCTGEGARVHLIRSAPETLFKGIVGSYGRISGAPSALAFIAQATDEHAMTEIGYLGEAAVLEATRLGLNTCWVGGFFNPGRVAKLVDMRAGEVVSAISPLGYARNTLSGSERRLYRVKPDKPKPRKALEEIAPGFESWPEWARDGVAIARLAPSAYNRQPWLFREDGGRIIISFDGPDTPKISKRIGCGIAMLNFEVGARHAGVTGTWEFVQNAHDVAAYTVA